MKAHIKPSLAAILAGAGLIVLMQSGMWCVQAQPLPGGTLDPLSIPKYVTPLVIPPEMPKSTRQPGLPAADYNIAVRQFKQQILPGGVWNSVNGRSDLFGATTVWSYGRAQDKIPANFVAPAPLSSNVSFNYPAFTVEATSNVMTKVRWINDLVDAGGNYLPHLFPIDQTLHWANPSAKGCSDGTNRTDCATLNPAPYTGPVPIVTHVHGAHVNAESDGYPEAWWLPAARNIPAGYKKRGSAFDQFNILNMVPGSAYYGYENSQPAATIWYHDHALGMTRANVYAGPAGFWLIRGGAFGDAHVDDASTPSPKDGKLPGPAPRTGMGDPNFSPSVRTIIREVPLAIQDRSFNADGSLFYPDNRAFFEGLNVSGSLPQIPGAGVLDIPFIPASDIAAIWNPEAFFNTMVVNGTTWPVYEVAPALYRLRLLNGCNSRTINLALFEIINPGAGSESMGAERPFFQIGGDQGFLPKVIMTLTGSTMELPGDGTIPAVSVPAPDPQQALLMGPAERKDVIVDFSNLPDGTVVRMINTGPDSPFGGFPADPADPATTGQVMQFVVKSSLLQPADGFTTPPGNLKLPAEAALPTTTKVRQVTLNEEESNQLCVQTLPDGSITTLFNNPAPGDPNFLTNCTAAGGFPMAPKAAKLGMFTTDPVSGMTMSMPMMWGDMITENPMVGDTEVWEIYNFTMDAHPIHLHLVRFQVVNREWFDMMTMAPLGNPAPAEPYEFGYKDTVIAYPGQITRIKAKFDKGGQYVWHCHIIEHEDNEMMRPYLVRFDPQFPDFNGDNRVDKTDLALILANLSVLRPVKLAYDLNQDGKVDLRDVMMVISKLRHAW